MFLVRIRAIIRSISVEELYCFFSDKRDFIHLVHGGEGIHITSFATVLQLELLLNCTGKSGYTYANSRDLQ